MEKTDQSDPEDQAQTQPAPVLGPSTIGAAAVVHRDPQSIGPYRILERIGSGGMGVVYKAEQREPVRRIVALKLIKIGMDSREVVARFEAERQALAMLSHPNVARVFEAGMTETGRPFFAMEHVAGVPLTRYCDQNKLNTRERLELFIPVCQAIQHAHQKGIIHRDLKPSNILVSLFDGKPVPKVIDFGIAKATNQALTQHTLYTRTGALIGTPEYMSPEQAMTSGLDVDTRTDIYSLGVILYELLTGVLPFDPAKLRGTDIESMVRMIKETEPPKPSVRLTMIGADPSSSAGGSKGTDAGSRRRTDARTLRREISGDLDWITLKAMEKDRTRRYETASGLAMDLRRHLENEPVLARPPSTTYRIGKFVRKHKGAVAAGMALAAAMLLGTVGTTVGFIRARAAQTRAIADRDAAKRATTQAVAAQAAERQQRDLADRRATQLSRQLYRFNIAQARSAIDAGELLDAQELLSACDPASRGWEWRYLLRQSGGFNAALQPIDGAAEGLDISPDGYWVACSTREGRVMVQSINGGARRELAGKDGRIRRVRFSPDGGKIATAGMNGAVRIWSVATGQQLLTLTTDEGQWEDCSWSPNGARLAIGGDRDGTLHIFDVASGKRLSMVAGPSDQSIWAVTYTPDGARLIFGCSLGDLICRDYSGEKVLWSKHEDSAGILDIKASADSQRILVHTYNGRGRVYDATSGQIIAPVRKPSVFGSAAISPDGQIAVTPLPNGFVHVWSASTGQPIRDHLQVSKNPVSALAFTRDGMWLVAADRKGGLHLVDADFSAATPSWGAGDTALGAVALSADGAMLATASPGKPVRLWSAATWQMIRALPGDGADITAMDFSAGPGEAFLTAGAKDGSISVWNAATGRLLQKIKAHPKEVRAVAISPDGTLVASGSAEQKSDDASSTKAPSTKASSKDNSVLLWDAHGGQRVAELLGHSAGIQSLQFSRDGSLLVSATWDGWVRTWHMPSCQPARSIDGGSPLRWAGLSPDGRVLLAVQEGTEARIVGYTGWDAQTGEQLYHFTPGVGTEACTAAFTPDSRRVAVLDSPGSVAILDASTGVSLLSIKIEGQPWPAFFTPDGATLVCLDTAGVLRFLEAGAPNRTVRMRREFAAALHALDELGKEWINNVEKVDMQGRQAVTDAEFAEIGKAIPLLRRIISLQRQLLVLDNIEIANSLTRLAKACQVRGDWEAAAEAFRQSADIRRRDAVETGALPGSDARFELSHNLADLGFVLLRLKQYKEAREALEECIRLRRERQEEYWGLYDVTNALGAAVAGQGDFQTAEPLLVDGYIKMLKFDDAWVNRKHEAIERIIWFYDAWKKPEKAKEWRDRAQREYGHPAQ